MGPASTTSQVQKLSSFHKVSLEGWQLEWGIIRGFSWTLWRNFWDFEFCPLNAPRKYQKLQNSDYLRFSPPIKRRKIKISKIPTQQSKIIPYGCPKPIFSLLRQFCEKKSFTPIFLYIRAEKSTQWPTLSRPISTTVECWETNEPILKTRRSGL